MRHSLAHALGVKKLINFNFPRRHALSQKHARHSLANKRFISEYYDTKKSTDTQKKQFLSTYAGKLQTRLYPKYAFAYPA